MATPAWIRNMLTQRGVRFEELHHPRAHSAQDMARCEHVSGHRVAKVVVVMADRNLIELVLPATRRVDLERVRVLVGARELRLATEAEMEAYFRDCEPGAVPPLRLRDNVPVVMDTMLDVDGDILFQAGTHEDAVRLRFDDWYRVVAPQVRLFSAPANVLAN
jgi:Ala-tRNA(Pro) deacylase